MKEKIYLWAKIDCHNAVEIATTKDVIDYLVLLGIMERKEAEKLVSEYLKKGLELKFKDKYTNIYGYYPITILTEEMDNMGIYQTLKQF